MARPPEFNWRQFTIAIVAKLAANYRQKHGGMIIDGKAVAYGDESLPQIKLPSEIAIERTDKLYESAQPLRK